MLKKILTYEELEELIEEATIDCYGEYEEINGFACTIEDKVEFPFFANIVSEEVEVIGIDIRGDEVTAVCKRKGKKHTVNLLDLEIDPKKVKGYKWIEAYRVWRG
ncbi:MAG: calcium-binding protein [Patescibacteria group bacterium]|nr:calcium-binding protein [Patescibacteria group bacterium]